MTEQLQALPVQDGQDPLNSYHEIVRRAFDSLLFGVFEDKPRDAKTAEATISVDGEEVNPDDIPFS